ncbi:MAG TPA: dihydropteroate synthase [Verrucomicrobiota bacterium]|nr:dihydropteroate synthase [Verrucomicrobiota bacterium]
MLWQCRHVRFAFPRPALVMGIVNVTPDSFSDGGRYLEAAAAAAHGRALLAEGADILDVGGESTRPGAAPVAEAEELRRVLPVVRELAAGGAVVSVDTMKPAVAAAALAAGAVIVNDVAAHRPDDAMLRTVAAAGAGYVAMHMQGTPATMQREPRYVDVVAEVDGFFGALLARLAAAGGLAEQAALDPGLGFGKTAAHNLALLANLGAFRKHQRPVLVGVSRKSFLGHLTGAAVEERLPAALACAVLAAAAGAAIFRTHDVRATRQALTAAEAVLAQRRKA